mmetsp:Transcript_11089/g.18500  ORF Transcript_11089/g.18500 Transcript_11089/m.18500 type:complete len:264 (-) Transcript_11089:1066-1857(-)
MCQAATPATTNNDASAPQDDETNLKNEGSLHANAEGNKLYPVHPLALVAALPLLPTSTYINRGYTVWFHLVSVAYVLTRLPFLRKFLILQGTGITLGWYAAIYNDLHLHGRFCHILYMNMPTVMKVVMVDLDGGIKYSSDSMMMMALSHALDTILHPGLVYLFWRSHIASGGTLKSIFAWDVIVATYVFSRLWSIVHTFANDGVVGLWYCGYDVYHINDLDSWLPAYVAESIFYAGIVIYKVLERRRQCGRNGEEIHFLSSKR